MAEPEGTFPEKHSKFCLNEIIFFYQEAALIIRAFKHMKDFESNKVIISA